MPKRMKPELHGAKGLPPSWSRPKVRTKRKNKRGLERKPVLSSSPHADRSGIRKTSIWTKDIRMGHTIEGIAPKIDTLTNADDLRQ